MNSGFHLIRSNKLESLAKHFIATLLQAKQDPFKPTTVITQTPAIARWLQLQIAETVGVSANFEMVRPESFLRTLLLDDTNHFVDDAAAVWHIFSLLKDLPDEEEFASVRSFVEGTDLKRFQLAEKMVELFDQYAVFRPDMVAAWNSDSLATKLPDEVWQRFVWKGLKQILNDNGVVTRDAVLQTMFEQAQQVTSDTPIYLFGVSSMPRYQLTLFDALSTHAPLHFYHLTPSSEYFGDMRKKEVEQLQLVEQLTPEKQPLLAELGVTSKNLVDWLQQVNIASETTLFPKKKKEKTLLSKIQSDMAHLVTPAPFTPKENDNSITVASTPNCYRECEILQNTLLDELANNTALQPRDIIVMTPDIQKYAPYIDAVFSHTDEATHIPYTIADRRPSDEKSITAALQTILALKGSRVTVDEIFTLFRNESIHRNFGIKTQSDIELLKAWVERSGIDWGIDKEHRERVGVPKKTTNSWEFGRERMILGIAMTESPGDPLFHNIIPFEGVKGKQAVILGSFGTFLDIIFDFIELFDKEQTLSEWADTFDTLMETLFLPSIEKEQLQVALSRETRHFRDFSTDEAVSFETVRYIIRQLLDSRSSFRGFISGRVTFCELKPMRAIPFDMVALIGMNENRFPRSDHRLSYDLIGQAPLISDRSIRENDRHLFLEVLLSARQRLHISYTGIDHQRGNALFPSVLVSRLLSIVKQQYSVEVPFEKHPIHSFSGKYFSSDSPLSSYSTVDEVCARQFASHDNSPLVHSPLVVEKSEFQESRVTLNLSQFATFFKNPPLYFAKKVLKLIVLETPTEEEKGATLFALSSLDKWSILNNLLQRYESAESISQADSIYFRELAGSGKLPWGHVGYQLFQKLTKTAWSLFNRSASLRDGETPSELFVNYHIQEEKKSLTLISHFGGLYNENVVIHNPSKSLNNGRKIAYLLQHLLMQTKTPKELAVFYGPAGNPFTLSPLESQEAERVLRQLAHYFFEGMTAPLPFIPDISAQLYTILKKGERDSQSALKQAIQNYDKHPSRFPQPFATESVVMSGLRNASDETAEKAADIATLIFGTLERGQL